TACANTSGADGRTPRKTERWVFAADHSLPKIHRARSGGVPLDRGFLRAFIARTAGSGSAVRSALPPWGDAVRPNPDVSAVRQTRARAPKGRGGFDVFVRRERTLPLMVRSDAQQRVSNHG